MRQHPPLVVLDEPTVSLDPLAEEKVYADFAKAIRDRAQDDGTITIVVSHRFSTARTADGFVTREDVG